MMPRGYDRALYILPFDYRASTKTREAAVSEIAWRYREFVGVFDTARRSTAAAQVQS